MLEAIELRLVNLAQKVANMYKDNIEQKYYDQLCNAITVCRDYYINGKGDWGNMYDVVLNDDGIWEYTYCSWFTDEIQNMWCLVTDILICNCYLGCISEQDYIPQDMEIKGDNIPKFVELLEKLICEKIDYEQIFEFFNKEMCY